MLENMDRTRGAIARQGEFDQMDDLYWARVSYRRKSTDSNFFKGVFLWKETVI